MPGVQARTKPPGVATALGVPSEAAPTPAPPAPAQPVTAAQAVARPVEGANWRRCWAGRSSKTPSVRSSGSPSGVCAAPWPDTWRSPWQAGPSHDHGRGRRHHHQAHPGKGAYRRRRTGRPPDIPGVRDQGLHGLTQAFPRLNAPCRNPGTSSSSSATTTSGSPSIQERLGRSNIKDADRKSIFQIAEEIVELVERADQRRLEVHELHGGTFTITNYGSVGGVFATPVINYPEVAILGWADP